MSFDDVLLDGRTVTIPAGELRRLHAIERAARALMSVSTGFVVAEKCEPVPDGFGADLAEALAALRVRFCEKLAAEAKAADAAQAVLDQGYGR